LAAAIGAIVFQLRTQILEDDSKSTNGHTKRNANAWKLAARMENLRVSPLSRG
jgi:hypothetical protein